jgi:hypothetical protein
MAKTVADIQLPAGGDADLARLLHGCGLPVLEKHNELQIYAEPSWRGQRTVTIHGGMAARAGEELLTLARRARDAGDPGADALFGLAAQLGYREPEPAPSF